MHARIRLSLLTSVATAALAVVFALGIAAPAFGASIPVSVESMSRSARAVVVAECVSEVSRPVDPAVGPRSGILTDVTLRLDETIAGTSADTVTITQRGGEFGGIGLAVSEVASFTQGGRYVVFLGTDGRVLGGTQGALAINGTKVGPSRESLTSLKRRVRTAVGTPMTFAETIADAVVASAADAAAAVMSPLATPVITSMTPSDVAAGTGDIVTLTGTGFGSSTGSIAFYRYSSEDLAASITSWSDTSITCEVPSGAGSGAVTVTNSSSQTSADYTYDVGFSYGGLRWPDGALSETYRVNANCGDATSSEASLISAAAATWSTVSNFSFVNGGSCISTENPPGYDGYNDIYWASSGFSSASTLAWNQYWYYTPSYDIFESDIVFNDAYTWNDGTSGTYDIQAVALHELGHSLNLTDQYGSGDGAESKVMYGFISASTQRRSLTEDDIAGIRWIYGCVGDSTSPVMGAVTSTTHPSETAWSSSSTATFAWSATDENPVTYSYFMDHTSGTTPDTSPEGTATSHTFTGLADGEWYLHVRARDDGGNWSTAQQRRIRIDTTAPSGTFVLNSGATATTTTTVTVDSSVTGAAEMRIAADGSSYGGWLTYAAQSTVSIPASEGVRTVAVQYRDAALNTLTLTGTISYDPDMRVFSWTEISGADRYATALAVSRSSFATGSCDTVIIATGANYPDALGAGGLAGAAECPILLVKRTGSLSTAVRTEISRLTQGRSAVTVYITGGPAAVSSTTEADLRTAFGSESVTRLGGDDRYETANLVALAIKDVLEAKGTAFSGRVFVTTGRDFPDALLASPVAYDGQRPILLVGRTGFDTELRNTMLALGVTNIDIVGSTTSVTEAVKSSMSSLAGVTVRRVAAGCDRYAMTVEFAEWACSEEGFTCESAGVATGETFPDALASGPMQGASRSLVVLTPATYLDSRIKAFFQENYDDAESIRFFGGTAAVTQVTRDAIIDVLE